MPPEDAGRPADHASAARRPRVLFVCADPVGERMAGLGIRCWELARTLSGSAAVSVAHGGADAREHEGIRLVPFRVHAPAALRALIDGADTVVAHPQWPLVNRWLRRARARVVVDLYCPETLETLELLAGRPAFERRQRTALTLDRLHDALRTGHNFMCASETQRDMWLGAMLALRMISPERYDRDASLRELIDLVPFGVPDAPPAPAPGAGPREAIAAIGADSEIVLWNGGIWRWLDADTAIRAVAELARRRPKVRLVFMGGAAEHPAAAASTAAARALARELGVLGSVVHFHERWVAYEQRGAWLAEGACALSAHPDHLETRFAYRTRLLDCLWAGLPIVCSAGDEIAARVAREDLGAVAPPADAHALSAALERVLERGRDAYSANLKAAAREQTWDRVARPLLRWVCDRDVPRRAGDEANGALRAPLAQRLREAAYLAGGRLLLARAR